MAGQVHGEQSAQFRNPLGLNKATLRDSGIATEKDQADWSLIAPRGRSLLASSAGRRKLPKMTEKFVTDRGGLFRIVFPDERRRPFADLQLLPDKRLKVPRLKSELAKVSPCEIRYCAALGKGNARFAKHILPHCAV